jgi:hypothetical protein
LLYEPRRVRGEGDIEVLQQNERGAADHPVVAELQVAGLYPENRESSGSNVSEGLEAKQTWGALVAC